MNNLDLDQHQPRCPDKTTVSCNSSEIQMLAEQPLQGLKLASHAVLENAQQRGRLKCSKCGGSRMFFCYTCCSLVGVCQKEIPSIKLPLKIDIIKHPNETDGKSTAVHAKILAPMDVTIYTYPCIPEYEKEKVVLVFPGPNSVTVKDMIKHFSCRTASRLQESADDEPHPKRQRIEETQGTAHTAGDRGSRTTDEAKGDLDSRVCSLERVVFIDSTWNQTNKISCDERLEALLKVELKLRKTCFWRSQKGKPSSYLATIEAIFYFLKDYHEQCLAEQYTGEYDNLLFFYAYLHSLITKAKISAGKL